MVKLWVRTELFEFGILPLAATVHVDDRVIDALVAALQARQNFSLGTKLRLLDWIAVAREHLKVSEEHATLYFQTFEILYSKSTPTPLEKAREQFWLATEGKGIQQHRSVNLFDFILFMYVQLHFQPIIRSAQKLFEDVWPDPMHAAVQLRSSPRRSPREVESAQHHGLAFVRRNLHALLHLCLSDQQSPGNQMSKQQLDRLGIIVSGGPNLRSETAFLSSLTNFWDHGNKLVPTGDVSEWVLHNLDMNTLLEPSVSRTAEVDTPDATTRLVINNLHKRTVVKSDRELRDAFVRIVNCSSCTVYLLAPVRNVHVSACHGVTIVIGACEQFVVIERCEKVRIVAAAKNVRVEHTTDATLHLCVNTPPEISTSCAEVSLAPFNTVYGRLEEHLSATGVLPTLNVWNQPVIVPIGVDRRDMPASCVHILQPVQFAPFCVPFIVKGTTVTNPCVMPPEYAAALQSKRETVLRLKERIAGLGVDESTARELHSTIEGQFKEWLASTGYLKQVIDLMRMPVEPGTSPAPNTTPPPASPSSPSYS